MQAVELYQQIERHGWPMVEALRTLSLSEREAEALFVRLDWLTEHLPALRAQWRGDGKEGRLSHP